MYPTRKNANRIKSIVKKAYEVEDTAQSPIRNFVEASHETEDTAMEFATLHTRFASVFLEHRDFSYRDRLSLNRPFRSEINIRRSVVRSRRYRLVSSSRFFKSESRVASRECFWNAAIFPIAIEHSR